MKDITMFEDMRVHSSFSDGRHTIEQNVKAAMIAGLTRIGCVERLQADTNWLPAFADEVERVGGGLSIEVVAGVQAKILTETGRLDLPDDLHGIDMIVATFHGLPIKNRCLTPPEVRTRIETGSCLR